MDRKIVIDLFSKYKSIIVWGLFNPSTSTQRHIHVHMHSVLKKIGCNVLWCENEIANNDMIPNGSLVLSSVECCDKIRYNKENWYVWFHRAGVVEGRNFLQLRVYGDSEIGEDAVHWNKTTMFSKKNHILSQSYGTDLLPEEFLPPIFNARSSIVNWVGSVWQDKNKHGNIEQIGELKQALQKFGLAFKVYHGICDEENIQRVRESRIAPAIGGKVQTKAMLPCRVWKNISYGQLCITNLNKSVEIFEDGLIFDSNIEELIGKALSVPESEYIQRTRNQQEIVAKEHTYLNWFFNVLRALEELDKQ